MRHKTGNHDLKEKDLTKIDGVDSEGTGDEKKFLIETDRGGR